MTWKTIAKDILIYILKVLIVILLVALAFIIGTMIGYSVIGEAGDPMDVFNPEIWQNILNYIF